MPYNLKQICQTWLTASLSRAFDRARTLHADERGTISIMSVVVLVLLTMLMGMILNVGEQIDDKIKMQNAVDAATYSSGVAMARGLNTLAFTNHLLSETFSLTAYFREGRDRNAESLVPEILAAWKTVGEQLGLSQFKLIGDIQPAMLPKIKIEQDIVKAFSEMTAVKARILIPPLEEILGAPEIVGATGTVDPQAVADTHLIPEFQRSVVLAVPDSSRLIAAEVAKRNMPGPNNRKTQCVIWSRQTDSQTVINDHNPLERMLPALDPSSEGPDAPYLSSGELFLYQQMARKNRDRLARRYLKLWIDDEEFDLGPFERNTLSEGGRVSAKQSQFINLYRGFTCAKLERLLSEEYPKTNLPHMLRQPLSRYDRAAYDPDVAGGGSDPRFTGSMISQQLYLSYDFTFMGAVYRPQRQPVMRGMYRIPIKGDAFSFAQVSVFLPKPRYRTNDCPPYYCLTVDPFDGQTGCVLCDDSTVGWPTEWSLFSQNWAARMVPASTDSILTLVQTDPASLAPGVEMPDLKTIQMQDLNAINFH